MEEEGCTRTGWKKETRSGPERGKTTWMKQNSLFRGGELRGVWKSELKSDGIEREKKNHLS